MKKAWLAILVIVLPATAFAQFGNPKDLELAMRYMNSAYDGPTGTMLRIHVWMAEHPATSWALLLTYTLALLIGVAHILNSFRGSDRICWFLVVMMLPVFGLPMYWLIGTSEKITESEQDYIKRMS